MITVKVISQDIVKTVLGGVDDEFPELDENWTVVNEAIAMVPGLLTEQHDMLLFRMYSKRDAYVAAKQAVDELRIV